MRRNVNNFELEPISEEAEGSGGFFGLALLALAAGAGSALLFAPAEGARTRKVVKGRLGELRGGAGVALERVQRELGRREARRRRERRTSALIGLAIGAGLTALLVPKSGSDTRHRIVEKLRRHRAGGDEPLERVVRESQPEPVV